MADKEVRSEIQDFYAGECVFITGGSGFLGKALLEKLLRSCPQVSKVYLLLRTKKDEDVDSRLKAIFKSPIFDILKQENPRSLEKVCPVPGDIELPNLGLSQGDRDILTKNVSIVFHAAASIKFHEPLKLALNTNYNGTQRILDLSYEMECLKVFVHVSTAYSNCDLPEINEEILAVKSQRFTPKEIQSMTDEEVQEITHLVIGNKPNTYTYAKCMAETLLKDQGGRIPICIVRPSIIVASWKEPQPGYVDSLTGITGMIAAGGKGMLTSLVCDPDKISDAIPLDVTVNLIIACGWKTAIERSVKIPVYNCCSGTINPITNGEFHTYCFKGFEEFPFDDVIRSPNVRLLQNPILNVVINIWFNLIPFLVIDAFTLLLGNKPRLLKTFNSIAVAADTTAFFRLNDWRFDTNNMLELEKSMGTRDRELFYWNIRDMDWSLFVPNYCLGVKKWIFKENMEDLPKAFARHLRVYCLQKCIQVALIVLTAIGIRRLLGF